MLDNTKVSNAQVRILPRPIPCTFRYQGNLTAESMGWTQPFSVLPSNGSGWHSPAISAAARMLTRRSREVAEVKLTHPLSSDQGEREGDLPLAGAANRDSREISQPNHCRVRTDCRNGPDRSLNESMRARDWSHPLDSNRRSAHYK